MNCPLAVTTFAILSVLCVSPFALDAETRLPSVEPIASSACAGCHGDATTGAHPVGAYTASAESAIRDPRSPSGFGWTIASDFLVDGRIECTSCHVSHDRETKNTYRLRVAENANALCTACHALTF